MESSSSEPSLTSDPMPTVMSLSRRTLPTRPSSRASLWPSRPSSERWVEYPPLLLPLKEEEGGGVS